MAATKKTTTKKSTALTEPITEEPKTELPTEPVIETHVEETKIKEPVIEEKVEEIPEPEKPTEKIEVKVTEPIKEELGYTIEEKIINFIESRSKGEIKMNDFLKSLYSIPKFNEAPQWLNQGASKEIRDVLNKLSNEGKITVVSNAHMKLGTFYYPDTSTMKTEYHNLNTIQIIAIKVN
ncbi:MAG: hypothetical protein V4547_16895 [Bacteroidota bacterium]